MTDEKIFTAFETKNAALWGRTPQRLTHRLDRSELFSMGRPGQQMRQLADILKM